MEDNKKEKIRRFLNDKVMSDSVYEVLLSSFLNDKELANEVHILAASRLSVTYLKKAWKDLEKFKEKKEPVETISSNVGL